MKGIKYLFLAFITILVFSCEEENTKRFTGENQSFVRFFLLANNNNKVLEFPEKDGGLIARTIYEKDNLKTLKIPVSITTGPLENPVTVGFETSVTGLTSYTIYPENTISFSNEKRVDTVYIKLNERWDLSRNPEIKLSLTSVSTPDISLGIPNGQLSNKELTIGFKETEFSYLFETNRKEIQGQTNESFDFNVLFPNGFIASEIADSPLFSTPSNFKYTIERKPIVEEDKVSFTLTVNENIDEAVSLDTFLSLIAIPNYSKGSNDFLQINKPIQIDREGIPVTNFYNLSDQFYRLFAEYWRFDTTDLVCEWRSSSVFPKPVVVDKNNPNGFLYDDNNTPNDDSDDVYHHKYKLGFVGNFPPIGTNPFAFRNLFDGASVESPGFNLVEAIEFFPKDGNSTTEGIVNVITQRIVLIRRSDDKAFTIPISGSGTYELIDAAQQIFKITLAIIVDATTVNGEIVTQNYVLFNTRNYIEPNPINVDCLRVINLEL